MKIRCTLPVCALLLLNMHAGAQTDTTHLSTDSTSASPEKDTISLFTDASLQQGAVTTDTTIRYRINGHYLGSMWRDLKYTVARPAHWQGRDFARMGAIVGGAALLTAFDYEIKQVFTHNQQNFWTSVTRQIEPFGNSYSPYLLGGMYLAGVITHDRQLEHGSLMAAKSLAISTLIYVTIKSAIRRGRPTYYDSPFEFQPPYSSDRRHTSFPSGHTLTVTTVATALSELYGKDHPWVPWVAYSIAGLTGITRLYENRHWSSDIWIGASLGYFVTKSIFRHHKELERKKALAAGYF